MPRSSLVRALLLVALVGLIMWGWYRATLPDLIEAEVTDTGPWTPALLSDSATIYLPDFSYAGYLRSEETLPEPSITHDARDFGVVADDGEDDTQALRAALDATSQVPGWVVLSLPPGRIDISGVLFLERDSLIIRGSVNPDGTAATELAVSGSLTEWADPKADSLVADIAAYQRENNLTNLFRPYSPYTWAGGTLWSRRPGTATPIPAIPPVPVPDGWDALSGDQGTHRVVITGPSTLETGAELELRWFNREGEGGSFLEHVLGPYDLPVGERLTEDPERPLITQPATIRAVEEHPGGWTLTLYEPLTHNIRPEWNVRLVRLDRISHVGIENLSIGFEEDTPAPHHLDKGYNGIYLTDTRDSWVKNVSVHDADTPLLTNRTNSITISGLRTTGREGHHSVYPSNSWGVLVRNFRLEAPALHHPTFPTGSILSVYTNGYVNAARLDQHGGLNQQNLYDWMTLDADGPWLEGGGAGYWNPVAGRYNTFWNVQVSSAGSWAGLVRDAPDARLVGLLSDAPDMRLRYEPNTYAEGLQRAGLAVPSLYEWQLERRITPPDFGHPPQSSR